MEQKKKVDPWRVLIISLVAIDLIFLIWILVSALNKESAVGGVDTLAALDASFLVSKDTVESTELQTQKDDVTTTSVTLTKATVEETTQNETTEAAYNTMERPGISAFDDWKAFKETIPENARKITKQSEVGGFWKGYVEYDWAEELCNFSISFDKENVLTFTQDWYRIRNNNEDWRSEEEMDDVVYTGQWADGALVVIGDINIRIDSFFEFDGKQYAYGVMEVPNGPSAIVGMVRP
ncbi:MAG: hypothetical protein IKX10_08290 [Lachnospiraceae bacterium]|jgi:hypothetical protein|nr:hypothetical protein [Lachnospiraceae bacterium]